MSTVVKERSRLSCRSKKTVPEPVQNAQCKTPTQKKRSEYERADTDYSPLFMTCTQDSFENIDVLWDWNSPQSKKCVPKCAPRTKKKRLEKPPSPKLPVKTHQSSLHANTFENLKEELRAFHEEISSLNPSGQRNLDNRDRANDRIELDLFDDSMEQQLFMASQQIENIIENSQISSMHKVIPQRNVAPLIPIASSSPRNLLAKSLNSNLLQPESPVKKPAANTSFNFQSKLQQMNNDYLKFNEAFDDSMDRHLATVDQQIENIIQKGPTSSTNKVIPQQNVSPLYPKPRSSPRNLLTKSFSSNMLPSESPVKKPEAKTPFNFQSKLQQLKNDSIQFNDSFDATLMNNIDISTATTKINCDKLPLQPSPLKFKTKSLSFGDHYLNTRSNIQRDADAKIKAEIEKKRLMALAKLRAKKKLEVGESDVSPTKFSPEEIEIKRQQALAKLEAKKKQEIIERNRMEALKRREMNRMKRSQNKIDKVSGKCR